MQQAEAGLLSKGAVTNARALLRYALPIDEKSAKPSNGDGTTDRPSTETRPQIVERKSSRRNQSCTSASYPPHLTARSIQTLRNRSAEKRSGPLPIASFEMAPNSFQAFWKQRMRWAQGWTQASIVHMPLIWTNPPNKKRRMEERFGVLSLLLVREISYYLVTQHTCLLLSFIIADWPRNPAELVRASQSSDIVSVAC